MKDKWFLQLASRPLARIRLFCFPSAGYGASMYREWAQAIASDVEVYAIRTAGRETRMKEAPLTDFTALVRETSAALQPYLDRPYAVFGHSMGAWLGFEVVRNVVASGAPPPQHLFVSGRRAPQTQRLRPKIAHLPDDQFIAAIQERYNGIPQEVLDEPDLVALLLPILRADMVAIEAYLYEESAPVSCGLTAYGGLQDSQVSTDQLDAWRQQTTGRFHVQQFPGGHYYFQGEAFRGLIDSIEGMLGVT